MILNNPKFASTYEQLKHVSLNPRRHSAANAHAHSEAVAHAARQLGELNGLPTDELQLLEDLGRAHDIGKTTGTAKPEKSLEVLAGCGSFDPRFLSLVKWHDTNLPWFLSAQRDQPPSDKAWRRLGSEVDVRLLGLFMVADRVDAPPGWRRNAPLMWFLGEATKRGLISGLTLERSGHASEVCAGGALISHEEGTVKALLIRVRAEGYELPKGGIEWDELPSEAAVREACEEAGLSSPVCAGEELGHLDYTHAGTQKRVRYFRLASAPLLLQPLPERTRERRWVSAEEAASIPLVNEGLRPLIMRALLGT